MPSNCECRTARWLFMHSADMHSDYAAELTRQNTCHVVEFNERCCSLCLCCPDPTALVVFTDRCVLVSNSLPKNYRQINWIIYRVNTQKTLISTNLIIFRTEHPLPWCSPLVQISGLCEMFEIENSSSSAFSHLFLAFKSNRITMFAIVVCLFVFNAIDRSFLIGKCTRGFPR